MIAKKRWPPCEVNDCTMPAVYTATPMSPGPDGLNVWSDDSSKPVPACRSHLTSVLAWMGGYEHDFHVSTHITVSDVEAL